MWNDKSFSESIYTGKINIDEAKTNQSNLFENLVECNDKSRPGMAEGKRHKKEIPMKVHMLFIKVKN